MQQGDDGFDFFSVAVVLVLVSCGILATVIIMFFNTTPYAVPEMFAAAHHRFGVLVREADKITGGFCRDVGELLSHPVFLTTPQPRMARPLRRLPRRLLYHLIA